MPDLDGVAATRQMAKAAPEVAARVLLMFNDDNAYDAMRAGARVYLLEGRTETGSPGPFLTNAKLPLLPPLKS